MFFTESRMGGAHDGAFHRRPARRDFVEFAPEFGRRFMLFVDTEEEFDWNAPLSRTGHRVSSMKGLAQGQSWFAGAGVRPIYVIDYPVLETPEAVALLREWAGQGTCAVGAHLHPWVTPPHEEDVTASNSYAGFLPEALERAKLLVLRDRIAKEIGAPPVTYRAGRYGVGPASARLLEDAGFRLDSSVRPLFDYRSQSGPDFYSLPLAPWRAGPKRKLVELPLSTAFTGALRAAGRPLFRLAQTSGHVTGAFSRLGLLRRVPLTPEGISAHDAMEAVDRLLDDGLRVLNLSFHSPSLEPGHTPYVRDAADLRRFYRWWDAILDHMARRSVRPASQDEFLAAIPPPRPA